MIRMSIPKYWSWSERVGKATVTPEDRALGFAAEFGASQACTAELLCDRHPEGNVAYQFVDDDYSVRDATFGELREQSERIATALRTAGVEPGDRVASFMGKHADFAGVLLGIWRAGAVYVPLFTAFSEKLVRARLESARAKVLFVDEDTLHKVASVPCKVIVCGAESGPNSLARFANVTPDGVDPARVGGDGAIVHSFTSGTTGAPKAVVHSLAYLAGWRSYWEFGLDVREEDVYWDAADPGWSYGLYGGVIAPLMAGRIATLVRGGFDAERTWNVISRLGVTNFAAAPTIYRGLRAHGAPRHRPIVLDRLSSAGEPLTSDVNAWAAAELGTLVHDHYGQTELGMVLGFPHHPAVAVPVEPNAMGIPLPGWALSVIATSTTERAAAGALGRLAIHVPQSPLMSFRAYHGGGIAEQFTADGEWYVTGDLARVDDRGVFAFGSREDDVMIMAGYRIGPFDVESVLLTHPAVAECAVVAAPDELRGEIIRAYVVLREAHSPSDELTRELQNLVKNEYSAHAYPREVEYRRMLPKTESGKLMRSALRTETP